MIKQQEFHRFDEVNYAEYRYLLSLKDMEEITLFMPFDPNEISIVPTRNSFPIELLPKDREILKQYLTVEIALEAAPCEELLSWCHGLSIEH